MRVGVSGGKRRVGTVTGGAAKERCSELAN
jgi:hypothetical protein